LRIAWWSPLPPQRSGISDYSYELLAEISKNIQAIAVVRDDVVALVRCPPTVPVIGMSDYLAGVAGSGDLDIYQMGNHLDFHGYMHSAALNTPGLLVLHDLALLDFYVSACGSTRSPVLLEEARADDPVAIHDLPPILIDGREELDRLRFPLSRRLVEASRLTIVHSAWLRDELVRRSPTSRVRVVQMPAKILPRAGSFKAHPSEVLFGVFGSLERHKRVTSAVKAFARVHSSFPSRARLVIAGRLDNPAVEREVRETIQALGIEQAVKFMTDVPLQVLEAEIARCDVIVCLRWPTAGEISAVLMRALGAGKAVIASNVPQYRDLESSFCRKISTDPSREGPELEAAMREVLEDPEAARRGGQAALSFVEAQATVAASAQGYLEAIEQCQLLKASATSSSAAFKSARVELPGVNVIGDWQATTGLAEAARRSVGALIEAGVTVAARVHEIPGLSRDAQRMPAWLHVVPKGRPHQIDICYLNVNELPTLSDAEMRPLGRHNYVIGYWFWEFPSLATGFVHQVERVDEIWVGSRFTREALLGHTDKPVHVMPCVVDGPVADGAARKDLDLPEGACIFFFHFDALSTFTRKDPWAVIQAFRRAFNPRERSGPVRLVIKTLNLSRTPPQASQRLVRELQAVNGILLDVDLSNSDMTSLISAIDVYVSLHRAEGFGLGIAEAMRAGRPAIATAYSGNLDFMNQDNSCLVGYRLRQLDGSETYESPGVEAVYEPGQLWAMADIDQAARWMRLLYENPGLRKRIGAAGAATIRSCYSSAAAGAAGAARLAEIAAERAGQPSSPARAS
jgi:glycosyltransferase involved in cell wall biosynthesis